MLSPREQWKEAWRYARFSHSMDTRQHLFTNVDQYRLVVVLTPTLASKARLMLEVRNRCEVETFHWLDWERELRFLAMKVSNSWRPNLAGAQLDMGDGEDWTELRVFTKKEICSVYKVREVRPGC
ncbi:hypothetical protein [Marinobacterium lutimaris]|uniref:Uncharacterized protein n=1 Tax=Marinobacterium lutimaris TaxID=568106 RepID=A0A1H5YAH3_9GAMM|nr:hypothetical protein [Marinobacterium lutimaris]SEG21063.1 hypothetical protein SAMN05444390_1011683 [Marinobacterium lutimaris]